jgi:transmembrane sensor
VDELIIKVLEGTASVSEEARVQRWRRESPGNEAHFQATEDIWSLTRPSPEPDTPPVPSAGSIITRAESAGKGGAGPRTSIGLLFSGAGRRSRRRVLALAAAVAAVVLVVRFVGGPTGAGAPVATYVAEGPGTRTVVLGDGTVVKLAPGSRLEEWSLDRVRSLSLEGRAFFAVTHDSERPLGVLAGTSEVQVLGTRFEVFEEERAVRVVVVEGRVSVSNEHGRVELGAGFVAHAPEGDAPTAESVPDVFSLLDWPDGLLVFQATPLAEAAREVSRHFGRAVEVRDEALGRLRITARFDDQGFEDVVLALCDVSGAECVLNDSEAVIVPGR